MFDQVVYPSISMFCDDIVVTVEELDNLQIAITLVFAIFRYFMYVLSL